MTQITLEGSKEGIFSFGLVFTANNLKMSTNLLQNAKKNILRHLLQ